MLSNLERAYKDYPEVLDCNEVAKMLGVHGSTITRYVRDGLKAFRTKKSPKAPFRFLKADVLRYIEDRQFESII